MSQWIAAVIAKVVLWITRVTVRGAPVVDNGKARVYFANHTSHGDFVLLWACLPLVLRRKTRPVAAADYWLVNPLRAYVVKRIFRAVLVKRNRNEPGPDPIQLMIEALTAGDALILFPEGTRHAGPDLLAFKSGIYHLACFDPTLELVPVWIHNMDKVLPKGAWFPRRVCCELTFGEVLRLLPNERKEDFLARAREVLLTTRRASL